MIETILNYFTCLDASIEILSNGNEQHITKLQSWVLCNRKIVVGKIENIGEQAKKDAIVDL